MRKRKKIKYEKDGPRIAPSGKVWICCACGKTVHDRYGEPISTWDESCMLNSVLISEADVAAALEKP